MKIINILFCLMIIILPLMGGGVSENPFRNQWMSINFVFAIIPMLLISIVYSVKYKVKLPIQITDVLFVLCILWVAIHSLFISPLKNDPAFFLYGFVLLSAYTILKLHCVKKQFLYSLAICGAIQSVIAYLQFFKMLQPLNIDFPASGTLFMPSLLGGLLSLSVIAVISLIRHSRLSKLIIVLLVINLAGLIISNSRAAWLATLVGCAVIFYDRIQLKRKLTLIIGVTCLFCLLIYFIRPNSANGRLLVWCVTTELIKEAPIVGNGADSFKGKYLPVQAEYLKKNPNAAFFDTIDAVLYPFNEALATICKYGIIGFFSIVALIVTSILRMNNEYRALMLAYIVFSLFSYPTESLLLTVIFIICISQSESKVLYNLPSYYFTIIVLIFCVWVSALSFRFYINYSRGIITSELLLNQDYILSKSNYNVLNLVSDTDAIALLEKQYKVAPYFSLTQRLSYAYEKNSDTVFAIRYAKLACEILPLRLSPKHRLMHLYHRYKMYDSAQIIANEILITPVKIRSIAADSIKNSAKLYISQ